MRIASGIGWGHSYQWLGLKFRQGRRHLKIRKETVRMTDIQDYWAQKEAEVGEIVVAKFYCTYLSGDVSVKGPLTGVLFFSSTTIYFQGFNSSKDLKTLFQMRRQEGISEGHLLKIPLISAKCSYREPPRSIWRRLFAPPDQTLVILHTEGEKKTVRYQFSVNRNELKEVADLINHTSL